MNSVVFALTLTVIITVVLLSLKHKDNTENNTNYGIKIFIVSFVTIFIGYIYMLGDKTVQEIDIGEPPF